AAARARSTSADERMGVSERSVCERPSVARSTDVELANFPGVGAGTHIPVSLVRGPIAYASGATPRTIRKSTVTAPAAAVERRRSAGLCALVDRFRVVISIGNDSGARPDRVVRSAGERISRLIGWAKRLTDRAGSAG